MISVIIPVYNRAELLKKTLDSVYAQTYKDIEIIVVDDGSEPAIDQTIIKKNFSLPIKLFRQRNKGAPAARNKGFELSKGEYVIFWDADIIGCPDMLEKMLGALKNNPSASYAYCDFYIGRKKMPSFPFDSEKLKKINYITTASLIRRVDFVRFDETLKRFQDWDLFLTMLEKGKTGIYIPEYLFKILPGGTMSSWLPSFAYKAPWNLLPYFSGKTKNYFHAMNIVIKKHNYTQREVDKIG